MSRVASAFPPADVTDPGTWDTWASQLAPISVDAERILVVAPHPDDETFGCGGLIAAASARGCEVAVVTVTDGGASHPDRPGLVATRRQEQGAALAALGCRRAPWWLGLPDGSLVGHETDLAATLLELARGSDLVVAPWPGDRHPDHELVGRTAIAVAAAMDVRVLAYPVWLWRWGRPPDLDPGRWRRHDLDPAAKRAKQAAMACYPSQTTDEMGATIVDAAMLDRFARPFEVFSDA